MSPGHCWPHPGSGARLQLETGTRVGLLLLTHGPQVPAIGPFVHRSVPGHMNTSLHFSTHEIPAGHSALQWLGIPQVSPGFHVKSLKASRGKIQRHPLLLPLWSSVVASARTGSSKSPSKCLSAPMSDRWHPAPHQGSQKKWAGHFRPGRADMYPTHTVGCREEEASMHRIKCMHAQMHTRTHTHMHTQHLRTEPGSSQPLGTFLC